MNKEEIKAKLTAANIPFTEDMTKADLMALLPEGSGDADASDDTEDLDSQVDAINAKAKEAAKLPEKTKEEIVADYLAIIAAYKKQNPKKYEIKKAAFEARLAFLRK